MGLKSCKECGKEISSKADKCPHCGAPVKKKGIGCVGAFLLIIFVLWVIGSLSSNKQTSSSYNYVAPSVQTPAPKIKMEIVDGWKWEDEGDWTYIRGSVKNVGDLPIGYFEVRAEYKNANGEVVDTGYTNSGERVNPGAAKKFEIMHRDSGEFKKVSIMVDGIRGLR